MESKDILYSAWSNDECYTPWYWVIPIIKYIDKKMKINFPYNKKLTIWCPFDTEESNFVKLIREAWHEVIATHIDNWQDFYNYEPRNWDIMISNPPFTNKRKIFERAIMLWKPFALLMTLTWLNDAWPKQVFKNHDLQLLMFDKRIEFIQPWWWINKKITFSSAYYCHDFLPKQIIMENLNI